MKELIETTLETRIRPLVRHHGGDVELVAVEEETGQVTVRLTGACTDCPGARLTFHAGVERILREHVPQVRQVIPAETAAEPTPVEEEPEAEADRPEPRTPADQPPAEKKEPATEEPPAAGEPPTPDQPPATEPAGG